MFMSLDILFLFVCESFRFETISLYNLLILGFEAGKNFCYGPMKFTKKKIKTS